MRIGSWIIRAVVALMVSLPAQAREPLEAAKNRNELTITFDRAKRHIVVSPRRGRVVREADTVTGRYKAVPRRYRKGRSYSIPTTMAASAMFSAPYSINAVGYVNLQLRQGLSLIATPLYHPSNTVAFWFPSAPDGAQVYKWTRAGGYEVSTFDGLEGAWSNPHLDISIGTGYYFFNPSADPLHVIFVGEVLQGRLVNPLPAGMSTVGALVPQTGSINTVHQIPGEPGDEIRIYVNDGVNGGAYQQSIFTAVEGWVPDLTLGVARGFWLQKQTAQDWIRYFSVN